ncbi:single-stranded DNA-binding protein [Mobilicoccus pelagius]|uniref:Single-stranded DNA-binding protein n=1 Tax=Mobilicoccus pelagius NBRC 104925 TaxID=1089455 RepID=H5UVB8_9MICO|nr:single-stranded DNA-binding protein [Mobilicoccus pelagius]GAB49676.1 single-stranded DNA-binding protein [Mobilicoccus pelagius NBRC 104925]
MNETHVTIRGNTTEDPRTRTTSKGEPMITVRLASTPWRWDSERRGYVDGATNFVTVVAYRQLATHIAASVRRGDPVVVHGELQISQWDHPDGRKGTNVEVKAVSMGHDLARGVSSFRRAGAENTRPVASPAAPSAPTTAPAPAHAGGGGVDAVTSRDGNGAAPWGTTGGGSRSHGDTEHGDADVPGLDTSGAGAGTALDPARADTDPYVVRTA